MRPRHVTAILLTSLVVTVPASAQSVGEARRLLSSGDTAQAVEELDRVLDVDGTNASAHYLSGSIWLARFIEGRDDQELRRAEDHFNAATRQAPDSALYWLGLARVERTKADVFSRMRSRDLTGRAVDLALAHGSSAYDEILHAAARVAWERYEQSAHRRQMIGNIQTVDLDLYLSEWEYVELFFEDQTRPDPGDPGISDLQEAERHLRRALEFDPTNVDALGLFAVVLGEGERWEEAREYIELAIGSDPTSGPLRALLGMVLTREGQRDRAEAEFDSALVIMSPSERAPYQNLVPLLRQIDAIRFEEMSEHQREQLREVYWTIAEPLLIEDDHPVRTEFYARLTYVRYRWSDPLRGVEGYQTDPGSVYLRYGPPDWWGNLETSRVSETEEAGVQGELANLRSIILWGYRDSQLRFAFSYTPGFARTSFAGDFPDIYRQASEVFPVRFDNVPELRQLDTVLVQLAQFRGSTAETSQLAVFSFMPLGRMAEDAPTRELQLETAAVVKDGLMRDAARQVRTETIVGDELQVERRSWRFEVWPGEYLLRVEANLPELERAARSTSPLRIHHFNRDSLLISDVIVARRTAPRDSAATRWSRFFIDPSLGRFLPDSPVALLWEVYNLEPDSTGLARYSVEVRITVEDIERSGFAARILGGIADAIGVSARGDDQVALVYDREVSAQAGGTQVEYITIDLEDAPKAIYRITVTVTDQVTDRSVSRSRRIEVGEIVG